MREVFANLTRRSILIPLLVIVLFTGACGKDEDPSRPSAQTSELQGLLDALPPADGAAQKSENVAEGTCASVTRTYTYGGGTTEAIAHYQEVAQAQGWTAVGQLDATSTQQEVSFLKDQAGEPLFLQVTIDALGGTYDAVTRSTPPNGADC